MEVNQNHTGKAVRDTNIRDVYPDREFTKVEQQRIAAQISLQLTRHSRHSD